MANADPKHVLFVDDEEVIRDVAIQHFDRFADQLRVTIVENGKVALEILERESVDLIVTDLHMPVMDGFELIGILNEKYPHMPVFVASVEVTPELDASLGSLPSLRFFKKPYDFNYLSECILADLKASAQGEISGIGVPSLLQLMEMEQRTCHLTIESDDGTGEMFFSDGKLIHAKTGTLVAEAAAYEIISWEDATVGMKSFTNLPAKTITNPLMNILLEGMRLKDEKKNNLQSDASDDRSLHREDTADQQGANEEYDGLKAQKASIPTELISLVKSTPGILALKIYNQEDFVLAKSSKQGSDLTIALSGYFESVSILENAMASGKFSYFLVNVRDGGRFFFFEFEQLRLILSLNPDFNITNFMQRVNKVRSRMKK